MTEPTITPPPIEAGDLSRLHLVAQLASLLAQVDDTSTPAEIAREAASLVCRSTPEMRRLAAEDLERIAWNTEARRNARAAAAFIRALDPAVRRQPEAGEPVGELIGRMTRERDEARETAGWDADAAAYYLESAETAKAQLAALRETAARVGIDQDHLFGRVVVGGDLARPLDVLARPLDERHG